LNNDYYYQTETTPKYISIISLNYFWEKI